MSDEEKGQKVEISWQDFRDYADPADDESSLLKPFSDSEKMALARSKEPLGPNLANSTMFVLLSENSSDPHFIKDSSLKYLYVNKAMEELLQRAKKDIIGKTDKDLFPSSEVATLNYATCRTLGGRIVREKTVRNIAGVARTFLDTLVPWRNDLGKIVAIYGVSVDIGVGIAPTLQLTMDDGETVSDVMRQTYVLAHDAAAMNTTVLLTGESGTGKDYLAKYIHDHSDRSEGPFQGVNCAALPKELVESELFGHEKGAFTGATEKRRGQVELADKGTLFLNEIGELPLKL